MNPDDNFGVGNPPEEVVIADEVEQGPGSDAGDTEVSLEPPIVDDGRRADVNTLRCDKDDRAGAPLEARIPDASGEKEEKEEEVGSGSESADSQASARFARARAANRRAHGLRARATATRQSWESEKEKAKRLLGRLKVHPKITKDSDGEGDSSGGSKLGQRRYNSSRSNDFALEKIPSMPRNPSTTGIGV